MSRFHVNSETGDVGKCRATTTGGCPFGGVDGTENHADSEAGARKLYEDAMSDMTHQSHKQEKALILNFNELGNPSRKIANPYWRVEYMKGSDLKKIRPRYSYLEHYVGDDYKIIGPAKTKTYDHGKVWQIPVIKDDKQHLIEFPAGSKIPISVNYTYEAERQGGGKKDGSHPQTNGKPTNEKIAIEYGDKPRKKASS